MTIDRAVGADAVLPDLSGHADRRQPAAGPAVRALLATAVVALAIVAWPARFGGATSVVIVSGSSMLPTLPNDTIVVARRAGRYDVGDVIAYPIPGGAGAGHFVIHRIVAVGPDGSYTTRGDNRATDDPWHPMPGEVAGRAVWHGGDARWARRVLALALSPLAIGLLAGWVAWCIARSTCGPAAPPAAEP